MHFKRSRRRSFDFAAAAALGGLALTAGLGATPALGQDQSGAASTGEASTGAPATFTDAAVAQQGAALRGMGEIRRRQERYAEALDFFQRAVQLNGGDVEARLGLAQSLRGLGRFPESLAETDRALAVTGAPETVTLQARVLRAQLLGDVGKPSDAAQALDALVASLPEKPPLETYRTLAQAFTGLRNYDAALQLLESARQDYPTDATIPRQVADTLTAAQRWDEAITLWDQVIQADPKDADAVLGKARVYNYSNRPDQAEALYRQVLMLEPDNYQALVELADVLSRRNSWPESLAMYRLAIERNPNDLATRVEMARVLRYSSKNEEAESVLNKVLEADPGYAPAYTERGILLGQQGRYDPAIADLRKALSITPTDMTAQLGLAEVLGYAKQYDESIKLYRAALERDPKNEKARTELGLVLSYAGRYDDAIGELNTVLQQNPQNDNALIAKADTLGRAGRAPEAINIYETILRRDPQNRRAQLGLADAYVYNRQYDNALKVYDALIAGEPDNTSYHISRARTLSYAGRHEAAVAAFRPIVEANPNDVAARLALATAMTDSGNRTYRNEAITHYQTILQSDPANAPARIGLGRTYSYMGRTADAEDQLKQVLKTSPNNDEALLALGETLRYRKPFEARKYYSQALAVNPNSRTARQGLSGTRRATSPYLHAEVERYRDSNDVRISGYELGPIVPTPVGTIGLTHSTGRFSDIDDATGAAVSLRRRALNLLLARNFGAIQARLLLNRVRYSAAPSRNLYDFQLQKFPGERRRFYAGIGRREINESLASLTSGITARAITAGFELPLGQRFDWRAEVERLNYSDGNSRTNLSAALLYRLRRQSPTLRVGLGYSNQDTEFETVPFLYYTPQNYNSFALLADYIVERDRIRYGISAAHPLTERTGNAGTNRPADTLFGYLDYDASDLLTLFVNGGIVRAPNFDSNQVAAGVNLRFNGF